MRRRYAFLVVPLMALLALGLRESVNAAAATDRGVAAQAFAQVQVTDTRFQVTETTVTFSVVGLPAGVQPRLYVDEPAAGGGFLRVRLASEQLTGSVTLGASQYLEGALLPVNDGERYAPRVRFQSAAGGQTTLTFDYVHEYLVVISRSSHGSYDPAIAGRAAGSTSAETQWATAGSTFTVTAMPEGRYHFSAWTVVQAGTPRGLSSRTNPLRVVVDQPLQLVAAFVAQ